MPMGVSVVCGCEAERRGYTLYIRNKTYNTQIVEIYGGSVLFEANNVDAGSLTLPSEYRDLKGRADQLLREHWHAARTALSRQRMFVQDLYGWKYPICEHSDWVNPHTPDELNDWDLNRPDRA